MDPHFGDWYRSAEIEPQHEILIKRQAAIEAHASELDDGGLLQLGRIFFSIAPDAEAVLALQAAMQASDSAFPMQDNGIELQILAGASLVHILKGKGTGHLRLVAAATLVCPALLGLRSDILVADMCSQAGSNMDSWAASHRLPSSLKPPAASLGVIKKQVEQITTAGTQNNFTEGAPPSAEAIQTIHSAVSSLVRKVNHLEKNQLLFREDSDILWWMTGEFSRDLGVHLTEIEFPGVSLVIGKELADLTHTQPGPHATLGVLDRCLRQIGGDTAKQVSLSQVTNKVPDEWRHQFAARDFHDAALPLCPLVSALRFSDEIGGDRKWHDVFLSSTKVSAGTKATAVSWAYQMYRESMFLKLLDNTNG